MVCVRTCGSGVLAEADNSRTADVNSVPLGRGDECFRYLLLSVPGAE
jgi:hypothetical protein